MNMVDLLAWIVGLAGAALLILAISWLLYDALIRWPRHARMVRDQQARGCTCHGAWDGVHEKGCQFYQEGER
jgi:hypothetical protein